MISGTVSTTLAQFEDDLEIRQVADAPGVYFISSYDRTLYVGQSQISMSKRLLSHLHTNRSPWLHYRLKRAKRCREQIIIYLVPCPPEQTRQKEVELIQERSPIYNLWH